MDIIICIIWNVSTNIDILFKYDFILHANNLKDSYGNLMPYYFCFT